MTEKEEKEAPNIPRYIFLGVKLLILIPMLSIAIKSYIQK